MKEIDFVYRTMVAELGQRCFDNRFETDFPTEGRFVTVPVEGRSYWYFDLPKDGRVKRKYVGPHSDPKITKRVQSFQDIKGDLRARRKIVSTLTREAGLPAPERFTGGIVEAMADSGLFRLRGVLVGTVAFQCYPALLGVRFPTVALQTGDADFAQFHSVSAAIEDTVPPMLETLRALDPTFCEVPHQMDGRRSTKFRNGSRFEVEFLTPNRGSSDHDGKPAPMPALGGASAQPLRFLDFLIHQPVRTVLLHRSGVSVVIPSPERYAVHKLIVAARRGDDPLGRAKREKDGNQSALLSEAMIGMGNRSELAEAFAEAWKRGRAWKDALRKGLNYTPKKSRPTMIEGLAMGLRDLGEDPGQYDLTSCLSPTP